MGSSSKKGTDATRAERKAKKRKLEDAIPDLPGDDAAEETPKKEKSSKKRKRSEDEDVVEEKAAKKEKKEKKSKKDKYAGDEEDTEKEARRAAKKAKKALKAECTTAADLAVKEPEPVVEEEAPKKSKKERKAERKAKEAANGTAIATATKDAVKVEAGGEVEEKKAKKNNRNRSKKREGDAAAKENGEEGKAAARFICFIGTGPVHGYLWRLQLMGYVTGNLPFSATTESVQKHFVSVKPKSVRLLTKKEKPTESKGCAFVEFDGYDRMKTCLKLLHHSTFDDGISPARKINVELT